MKIGMIFECGPDGADRKVCEHLARMIQPESEIVSVTLDNKPKLVGECGTAARRLLDESCERIFIVWDLYPAWRKEGQRPCRREDREAIQYSLSRSDVPIQKVALICIEEELDAWLLADGRALSRVLSRQTHPATVRDMRRPDQIQKPKTRLNRIFRQHARRPYVDRMDARKIVQALPDLNKIRRSITFVRFEAKLMGREP